MRTQNVSENFDESRDEEMLGVHRKVNLNLMSVERDTFYWRTASSRSICAQSLAKHPFELTMMDGVDELFGNEAAKLAFQQFQRF